MEFQVTYPDGFGKYIAGKFTFRETLSDFIANCTMSLNNITSMGESITRNSIRSMVCKARLSYFCIGCNDDILARWSFNYHRPSGEALRSALADGLIPMPNVLPSMR